MERIIYVEKPLHELVYAWAFAPFAVVKLYERYCEDNAHLHETVHPVDSEAVHGGVYRNVYDQPYRLRFEFSSVRAECEYAKACDTAPVARERHKAYQQYKGDLDPLPLYLFAVDYAEHNKSPRKRPDNARLVEEISVIKRDKRLPVDKISRGENICKVRYDRKHEQSAGIFADIFCVVITLCDKVAHNGAGYPADDM